MTLSKKPMLSGNKPDCRSHAGSDIVQYFGMLDFYTGPIAATCKQILGGPVSLPDRPCYCLPSANGSERGE